MVSPFAKPVIASNSASVSDITLVVLTDAIAEGAPMEANVPEAI